MEEQTAILANYYKYGFNSAQVGFIEPSSTFNSTKRMFSNSEGIYRDVDLKDVIEIELSEKQKREIFPLYE